MNKRKVELLNSDLTKRVEYSADVGCAFSDFCGVEFRNQVPDGDTLGRFRNLLLKNSLQEKLFAQVVELLTKRGLILKKGIIVDSTFLDIS